MKLGSMLLSVATTCGLLTFSASAHDPSEFDRMFPAPASLAIPTTCEQLADSDRYSTDETHADIKTLKARCDAEKPATPKAVKTKVDPVSKDDERKPTDDE